MPVLGRVDNLLLELGLSRLCLLVTHGVVVIGDSLGFILLVVLTMSEIRAMDGDFETTLDGSKTDLDCSPFSLSTFPKRLWHEKRKASKYM